MVMFRVSDRKKSRALATLLEIAKLPEVWDADGPRDEARRLRDDPSGLAATQRMALTAAWALFDGSSSLRVTDLWLLDTAFGEALSDLILALSEGDLGLDRWMSRYSPNARSGTVRIDLDEARTGAVKQR